VRAVAAAGLALFLASLAAGADAPSYTIDELQVSDAAGDWASAHYGEIVACTGGIVTHKFKQRFVLRDPSLGEEWSAIEVRGYPVYPTGIAIGDQVDFDSVYVDEYRGVTVLQYYNASGHTVNSSGNPIPPSVPLSLHAIRYPAHPEDCERYASLHVTIAGPLTIGSRDLGAHADNYELLGAADTAWSSDYANGEIDSTYYVASGECYESISGILQRYTYGAEWDYYQLLPIGAADYEPCGVDVAEEPAHSMIRLLPAYPNPARAATWLAFELDAARAVRIEILDPSGRCIRRLTEQRFAAGVNRIRWNGADAAGARLPAGLYLARLTAGGRAITERLCRIH
jgi:hypothetical protein